MFESDSRAVISHPIDETCSLISPEYTGLFRAAATSKYRRPSSASAAMLHSVVSLHSTDEGLVFLPSATALAIVGSWMRDDLSPRAWHACRSESMGRSQW